MNGTNIESDSETDSDGFVDDVVSIVVTTTPIPENTTEELVFTDPAQSLCSTFGSLLGWGGDDCSVRCVSGEFIDGVCTCTDGYWGEECDKLCYSDDNGPCGAGKCNTTTGLCIVPISYDTSSNGTSCNEGWYGADCSVAKSQVTGKNSSAIASVYSYAHYTTFDGASFTMDTRGEFKLFETEHLHIFVRQVPCGTDENSCVNQVWVKTLDGDDLTVRAPFEEGLEPVLFDEDGSSINIGVRKDLGSDVWVEQVTPTMFSVADSSDTEILIRNRGRFLDLQITVDTSQCGTSMNGVLGTCDGNMDNDFKTADDTTISFDDISYIGLGDVAAYHSIPAEEETGFVYSYDSPEGTYYEEPRDYQGAGHCLVFNNTRVESNPLTTIVDESSDITIEFKFKAGDANDAAGTMVAYTTDNTFEVIYNSTVQILVDGVLHDTNYEPTPDAWEHITLGYERDTGLLIVYVLDEAKNINVERLDIGTGHFDTGGIMSLGGLVAQEGQSSDDVPPPTFIGRIDELRVWDTTLDVYTVLQNFDADIDTGYPNLVGSFGFDEGYGDTITDTVAGELFIIPTYDGPKWQLSDAEQETTTNTKALTDLDIAEAIGEDAVALCRNIVLNSTLTEVCGELGAATAQSYYVSCLEDLYYTGDSSNIVFSVASFTAYCQETSEPEELDQETLCANNTLLTNDAMCTEKMNCRFGEVDSEDNCICFSGFWGEDCGSECPGGIDNICNGLGTCNMTDGTCKCEPKFSDESNCVECAEGWKGSSCNQFDIKVTVPEETIKMCPLGTAGIDCSLEVPIVPVTSVNGTSTATINGDGSYTTYDGVTYHVSVNGEFTFVNTTNTSVTVRQTPADNGDSVVNQVWVSTGDSDIVIKAPVDNTSDPIIEHTVPGDDTAYPGLPDDGSVMVVDNTTFIINTTSGDVIEVTVDPNSESLTVEVIVDTETCAYGSMGMAGSCDGDLDNELSTTDPTTGEENYIPLDEITSDIIDDVIDDHKLTPEDDSQFIYTYENNGTVYEEPRTIADSCPEGFIGADCSVAMGPSGTNDTHGTGSIKNGTFTNFEGVQFNISTKTELMFVNTDTVTVYVRTVPCGDGNACVTQAWLDTETEDVAIYIPYGDNSNLLIADVDITGTTSASTPTTGTTLDMGVGDIIDIGTLENPIFIKMVTKSEYIMTDSSGTQITFENNDGQMDIVATVETSTCLGTNIGLLGQCDGNLNNDFQTGNNSYVPVEVITSDGIDSVIDNLTPNDTDTTGFVYVYEAADGTIIEEPEEFPEECPDGFTGADCTRQTVSDTGATATHSVAHLSDGAKMTNYDGATFDISSGGEYSLVESDIVDVNIRTVPCGDSVCANQVWFEEEFSDIVLHAPYSPAGGIIVFDADGNQVGISGETVVGSNMNITRVSTDEYHIVDSGDQTVVVKLGGNRHLDITVVTPNAACATSTGTLVGSCDGNLNNDLVNSEGVIVPYSLASDEQIDGAVQTTYIDPNAESNFVYTYETPNGDVYEEPKEFTESCICGFYADPCCVNIVDTTTNDTHAQTSIVNGTFTTYDGVQYDIDVRGEYQFYNSTNSSVYIRMTPCGQEACVTQIQVGTTDSDIVIHAPYTNGSEAVVFYNGTTLDLETNETVSISSSTTIKQTDDNEFVIVNEDDGTETTVNVNGDGNLDVTIESPKDSCSSDVTGMSGSCDGDINNEIPTGDGDYVDPTTITSDDLTNMFNANNEGSSGSSDETSGSGSGSSGSGSGSSGSGSGSGSNTNFVYEYTDENGTTYSEPETLAPSCPVGFYGADCSIALADTTTNTGDNSTAGVNPDGSVTTFDGVTYNTSTPGEFALVNTTDLDVNVWQTPCGDEVCTTGTTINTGDGGITINTGDSGSGSSEVVDSDGNEVDLTTGDTKTVGDLTVSQDADNSYTVTDDLGNSVTITGTGAEDGNGNEVDVSPGQTKTVG
ncbi:unnamed protein product [Owenia fusiformis]|uniref:VWFD domain-containing protein n=1 Tax=Owenia fusiformis TaxID=6347 RepID=A0A8S4N3X8_OWEFU|nr:unnamed protein product [Owenia fusiformis]